MRRLAGWFLAGKGMPFSLVLLCSLAYAIPFPLAVYYGVPNANFARITGNHWAAALGLAGACLGILLLSIQMYRLAAKTPGTGLRLVWLGWAGASLVDLWGRVIIFFFGLLAVGIGKC